MRYMHILLLPVWLAALAFAMRFMAAESSYQASSVSPDSLQEIFDSLDRAAELNPWQGLTHGSLGRAHIAAGRAADRKGDHELAMHEWKAAIDETRRAMQLDFAPDMPQQLASAYLQRKDFNKAQDEFQKLLDYYPGDSSTLFREGHLLSAEYPRPVQALALARQSMRYKPPTADIYYVELKSYSNLKQHRAYLHSLYRFIRAAPGEGLTEDVTSHNWAALDLTPWNLYLRDVELGFKPSEATKLDAAKPMAPAAAK